MSFGNLVSVIATMITILGVASTFIYKIIRGAIMEEVKDMRDNLINIVVNQKNTLEEQIIMTNKNTTKYIGTACETKIKENEEKNEKIRIERQLRYSENLDSIRLSLDIVRAGLDKIQYDINSYGNKMHEHTIKIDRIEKDIDYLKKA